NKRQFRGFTLIEVIIFIVVVGAGLAGILSVTTTSVKSSADPLVRKQALAIAESLLEEILLKEFKDPAAGGTNGQPGICNAGAGTNRTLWTNVCEYNGYTSTGITDAQGGSVASLSLYKVLPAVTVADTTIVGVTLKKVVVQVTDTQNNVISLIGYRGDF
ncbi:MAG: prepilin-type N-terminal cleavage/methylation domain-containing protein, partial [Rhodoferax sp.]